MGEVALPNEIWMEIFKHINRQKLMELRLVCRRFCDLIEDLLNKDPNWKDVADAAISFECVTLMMQRAYPYDLVTHFQEMTDPVLWRGTYLSFKKWQKVLVNEESRDTILPLSTAVGGISCICTFDKYIAIAFEDGSIANYTLDNLTQPFYFTRQSSGIDQIEFWYSNGEVLVVTVGEDYTLRFYNIQKEEEIFTEIYFANSICCGECRHFCIGEMNGILTSYEREGNKITVGPTKDLYLTESERLIAHAIDGKNMTALAFTESCTVMYLYSGLIQEEKLISFRVDQVKSLVPLPENLNASIQRLVMPTITFFFGIGEDSIGSTNYYEDEWHEYNLVQHFGSHVRSMALHAQILMFGLDDGSVHLVHIEHYGEVIELEDTIRNARKIQVDDAPIRDLTVLEVDKKPCIVAMTEQRVHLLNFF